MRLRSSAGLPFLLVTLACLPPAAAQQAAPAAPAPERVALTPAQMEAFLKDAKIIRNRGAGGGVTGSRRVTLTDGVLTHDAHVQFIDQSLSVFKPATGPAELNFRDSYKFNIAAYRLALVLGLDNVPMSVERRLDGKNSAVTWWLDDVLMDERARLKTNERGPDPERFAMQTYVRRVFDELIANRDRNLGNLIWTRDWKMWMIDHTRSFRLHDDLQNAGALVRIDRAFFERLQALTADEVTRAVGPYLTGLEVRAVMLRRDAIVQHYKSKIAALGERSVVYTPGAPSVVTPAP